MAETDKSKYGHIYFHDDIVLAIFFADKAFFISLENKKMAVCGICTASSK